MTTGDNTMSRDWICEACASIDMQCFHNPGDVDLAKALAAAMSTPDQTEPWEWKGWWTWMDDASTVIGELYRYDPPDDNPPWDIATPHDSDRPFFFGDHWEMAMVINDALFVWGRSEKEPSSPELVIRFTDPETTP